MHRNDGIGIDSRDESQPLGFKPRVIQLKIAIFAFHSCERRFEEVSNLLLLTNNDVEQVLTMADCVDVLRRFFEEEGKGQVLTRQRTESWLPHLTTDTFYQCKTMEGGVPYIGKYVIPSRFQRNEEKAAGSVEPRRACSLRQRELDGHAACFLYRDGRAAWLDARRLSTAHPRGSVVCPRRRLLGAPGCRRSRTDRLGLAGRRANSRIALRAEHQEGPRLQLQCRSPPSICRRVAGEPRHRSASCRCRAGRVRRSGTSSHWRPTPTRR